MVEYWNVGFNKKLIILTLLTSLPRGILSTTRFSIFPEPIIPLFHCSIIPIAERSGAKFNFVLEILIGFGMVSNRYLKKCRVVKGQNHEKDMAYFTGFV